MNLTPAEFARHIKKSRQYVNKLIRFAKHLRIAFGERGHSLGRGRRTSGAFAGADDRAV